MKKRNSPFTRQGPKRRRRARRQMWRGEGHYSQWAHCWTNFKREREAGLVVIIDEDELNAARRDPKVQATLKRARDTYNNSRRID